MNGIDEKNFRLREALERRILHGIACEWDEALWVLPPREKAGMKPPLFRLEDLKGRWGHWSGERREICLSNRLVLDHPWDAVRAVLHHEMAHQMAEEVLGAGQEKPHGPKFVQAARLLRAAPEASGRFRLLDERTSEQTTRTEDKVMMRVKKLMALAESRNRHEAEAAMAKAHELIEKFNVDLLEHNGGRDFVSLFVGKPALRHRREHYHLAHLLQEFYFVRGLWVSAYVLDKGKMGRVLEINGTVENGRIADYVHDFVLGFIDSQWRRYNERGVLGRNRKTDFAVGIIEGFRSKLESQRKAREANRNSMLPVKLKDPLLDGYVAYRYPHTTTFRRKVSSQDDLVLREGMRLGKRLVIHEGITERKGNGGLLIVGK